MYVYVCMYVSIHIRLLTKLNTFEFINELRAGIVSKRPNLGSEGFTDL